MNKVVFHKDAQKFLEKISYEDFRQVVRKLEILQKDPFNKQLKIKKLVDSKLSFRLRIGKIRVIYELHLKKKVIFIRDIDFRGNVY